MGGYISGANLSETYVSILAVSRQSGQLQLFDVSKIFSNNSSLVFQITNNEQEKTLLWSCTSGCGTGSTELAPSQSLTPKTNFDQTFASEIRFFFCGPSNTRRSNTPHQKNLSILRSLCLLIETNHGDLHLYTGSKSPGADTVRFVKVPLRMVTRPSKEEQIHRNRLKRRDIVVDRDDEDIVFRCNKLHRFYSLSGQDGLFSATSRPLWFVSERGAPSALSHRLRHCAPAGGTVLPVSGFCSGLSVNGVESNNFGFMTVHERIGRVGSQRITCFNGYVL